MGRESSGAEAAAAAGVGAWLRPMSGLADNEMSLVMITDDIPSFFSECSELILYITVARWRRGG